MTTEKNTFKNSNTDTWNTQVWQFVQKQFHLNRKQLTCMFVCQHNERAWDVSSPVETHHLRFHVSIGSLKQGTKEKNRPLIKSRTVHSELGTS